MRLALSLVAVLVCASPVAAQATYQMPAPVFGYTEVPPGPVCFVNNANPVATDSGNPCGTVLIPRRTVPTAALSCGAVVNVDGGGGTGGGVPYSGNATWTSACGSATGAFIIGVGYPIFQGNGIGNRIRLTGSYLIVDGFNFISTRIDLEGSAIGLRNFAQGFNTSLGGVLMLGSGGVVSRCLIQRNGNYLSPTESDRHGVTVARGAVFSWVLGCEIHHNSGDSIQIGDTNETTPGQAQYTFVGGNTMHEDRENAVDIKFQNDTIVSQNIAYGYAPTDSSEGAAYVVHNEGARVWFINNYAQQSTYGIVCTGAFGFIALGNILVSSFGGTTPSQDGPAGISIRNCGDIALDYNTLYSWDQAISFSSGISGTNEIVGNIAWGSPFTVRVASGSPTTSSNIGYPVDVSWVNPSLGNYRLALGSVALNAGTSAPAIVAAYNTLYSVPLALDLYGASRANPYSIGASQLGVDAPGTGPVRLRVVL